MIDWLARIVCSKVERGGGADDTADTDFVTHSAPCSSLCTRVSRRSLFVCIGEMLTQHPQRTLDNFSWWGVFCWKNPFVCSYVIHGKMEATPVKLPPGVSLDLDVGG